MIETQFEANVLAKTSQDQCSYNNISFIFTPLQGDFSLINDHVNQRSRKHRLVS